MADYISRDDVLKAIDYQHEVNNVFDSEAAYVQMWETINDDMGIKSADVQPVKHGKWILFAKDNVGRAFYCSNCRKATTTDDFENSPLEREEYFCPRCGARMDGDTNG